MSEQMNRVLIAIISRIPEDIRTGGEGWAMAGAFDRIAAIWPKSLDVAAMTDAIWQTCCDSCDCENYPECPIGYEKGCIAEDAAEAIAASLCAPVEKTCNGHYVTEHEHGSLNNVTVSVAVLLTACGKRQPADSRYCQECGGKIKIEG